MRKALTATAIVAFAVFIAGIILLTTYESPKVYYSGTLEFSSTQEYTKFKDFVISPQVDIKDIDVLSSEPPIWVQYRVTVPRELTFPYVYADKYGDTSDGRTMGYCAMIGMGFAFALMGGLATLNKEVNREEEQ